VDHTPTPDSVFVLTGVMASGKSTVAELLAQRFDRGVHVRGDAFRKMIVSGRAEITPDLPEEAVAQLELRRRIAARTADDYWRAGFDVVVQDILIGDAFVDLLSMITARPLHAVVLVARPSVIAERERARPKTGYGSWTVAASCDALDTETAHVGLWLDTSELSPEQTVDEILRRRDEAVVNPETESTRDHGG
jgi:chloramphenicol 3-O-phosphotransferase